MYENPLGRRQRSEESRARVAHVAQVRTIVCESKPAELLSLFSCVSQLARFSRRAKLRQILFAGRDTPRARTSPDLISRRLLSRFRSWIVRALISPIARCRVRDSLGVTTCDTFCGPDRHRHCDSRASEQK